MKAIPVIDIFAGPGGLSEGFAACAAGGQRRFSIRLSIEKDQYAHRTLELRAFVRQFNSPPPEYYQYVEKRITRDQLFDAYPGKAEEARAEAWHAELGSGSFPFTAVDERVSAALGAHADRWALIGGPPCQAYSLVGRSRIRGASKTKYEADERHYLYRQYLRILDRHNPPVFVLENVKGLLSARVSEQRIVENIIRDLANPSAAVTGRPQASDSPARYTLYSLVHDSANRLPHREPEDFVVRSEEYGIPQTRHRIILLGVRSDIRRIPRTLEKRNQRCTIDQAIADLPKLRSSLSREPDSPSGWYAAVRSTASADWINESAVDPEVRAGIRKAARDLRPGLTTGDEFFRGQPRPVIWSDWYRDPALHGFCNHVTRGHISPDLQRYLFAAVYGAVHGQSPGLEDFPTGLLPKHANVMAAILGGKFNDRFRVQISGRPSTTVTAHLSKDGHYFIHPDPTQCRSLTVREAARLQTFPDNYFFEGPRTEQYKQVGNAVPPLLAKQIAEIVADILA